MTRAVLTSDPVPSVQAHALAEPDFSIEAIETIEARLLGHPQVDIPLTHRFAPGVYLREVMMPAGTFVIGHQHRTAHFNLVITGRATVMMNGERHEIVAPCTFVSDPCVRKVLFIHEDMTWQTIHPTTETDLDKLEAELIIKSASYLKHLEDMKALKSILTSEGKQP